MMRVLVVSPHPDDETLGCGGTLLRHQTEGDEINWLIVTSMQHAYGYSKDKIAARNSEIEKVKERYSVFGFYCMKIPTTQLDTTPMKDLVEQINKAFHDIKPEILYLPYRNDVHSDHTIVFDAVASCTKWFRFPFIKKILAYETLS